MYSDFCEVPEKIQCSNDPKDGYYLPTKECNGYNDCANGSDETIEKCGVIDKRIKCGQTLTVGDFVFRSLTS